MLYAILPNTSAPWVLLREKRPSALWWLIVDLLCESVVIENYANWFLLSFTDVDGPADDVEGRGELSMSSRKDLGNVMMQECM